ncbi:ABC transporter substrate-binding protein [Roseomonas hellenica]|uniref:ABC transporter substrate-binding protein n=1 Tax=Plastoroseomonas hellenica TaxID=2687306 RepID=A0ABS5EU71_9PROT|nr:ABC transporter substrate-binding protein [Plastoroseomonas hellenica]MBR0663845.1 ABC transporter substrate-binding protein [Plastoroseomonas hellenica]
MALDRRRLLGAGAALGAALAAPRLAEAQNRRVLRFIPQADLGVLDPIWTAGYVTRNHGLLVFDTLYGTDSQMRAQPQMVEGHRVEDAGHTWILTLREGLLFHDGQPVLARDCVASIQRWGRRDSFGQSLLAATDELRADDDRTIRFRLKKPFPLLAHALGKAGSNICAIMPQRLAETDPFRQVTEMVGSGPFRFLAEERVAGARTVYARFDRYQPRQDGIADFTAGPKRAHFDRIEWHVLPDTATAAAAMQSGEMDWWENPSFDLLPLLRRQRALEVSLQDRSGYIGNMRFNQLQPPFNNPALRRAILRAVRQEDFMQAIAGDNQDSWTAGVGFFCPGTPMATDAGLSTMAGPRDMAAARREVAASGYAGERVVLPVPNDFPILKAMGEVGADLLKQVGLNVDVQATDWGSLLQRLAKTEPVEEGGWSVFHTYWSGLDQLNPAVHAYLRANGRAGGRGWPTSPQLESLRAAWLDAGDEAEQKRIAVAMQEQALQDVPYVPLGQMLVPVVRRRELRDMLNGFSLFWNIRRA